MNSNKLNFTFLILFLAIDALSYAMEIEAPRKVKPPKPTIKATVYFNPNQPAFYATEEQIKYLRNKGVAAALPIMRPVSHAIVKDNHRLVINWLHHWTYPIGVYYTEKLKTKPAIKLVKENDQILQLDRAILKGQKLYNCCFPAFLPAELAFNCANGSRISLTIHGFPTEVTFESENDFYAEHQQVLSSFFPDEKTLVKSLIDAKTSPDKSMFKSLMHRELTGSFK
jgi:hypothetical protein